MEARAPAPRPEPERSLTWPQTLPLEATDGYHISKGGRTQFENGYYGESTYGFFEEDLENHPESHFLSPIKMYEYEDWADDSDSDGEEVEWDAGITDFALFDDDRRRAQESNQPLPSKWTGMLAQQTSALQRAVNRHRADSDPQPLNRPKYTDDEEPPSLTPDTSPDLKDDLDVESYHGQNVPRPSVPNYLTITVTPPEDDDEDIDDSLSLSYYVARRRHNSPDRRLEHNSSDRKLERPGLKHSRTMSGRVHTWTRPSVHTVSEDTEGEEKAKREDDSEDVTNEEIRGRK